MRDRMWAPTTAGAKRWWAAYRLSAVCAARDLICFEAMDTRGRRRWTRVQRGVGADRVDEQPHFFCVCVSMFRPESESQRRQIAHIALARYLYLRLYAARYGSHFSLRMHAMSTL